MTTQSQVMRVLFALTVAVCLAAEGPLAQRGGGGGGGAPGGFSGISSQSRLGMLTAALHLTDAQKKDAKAILDAASKEAAPIRAALEQARTPIGVAIQAGRDQAEIDRTVAVYADRAAAMAGAEMRALATIVHGLTPEQQANASGITTAEYLMRGAFLGKKWDTAPDLKFY